MRFVKKGNLNLPDLRVFFLITIIFCSCAEQKNNDHSKSDPADSAVRRPSPIMPHQTQNVESHYPNGRLKIKGVLNNGKREGLWISWYENGQEWSECMYKDGLKNGRTSSWHENGMRRYDGFYTNDVKSGKWVYWNDKGVLVEQVEYDKTKK